MGRAQTPRKKAAKSAGKAAMKKPQELDGDLEMEDRRAAEQEQEPEEEAEEEQEQQKDEAMKESAEDMDAEKRETSLLATFWKMSDLDEDKRLEGLKDLESIPSVVDVKSEDHEYTMKRLLNGLCSSNGAARFGFAVALTRILRSVGDKINVAAFVERVKRVTEVSATMKNVEQKDKYLGRMLALSAVARAGRLIDAPADLGIVVEALLEIVEWRSWAGEFCMAAVCDAFEACTEACVVTFLEEHVRTLFPRQYIRKYSASKLAALATIELRARKSPKIREALDKSPVRFPSFAAEGSTRVELQDMSETLKDATSFPRLHLAWVKILDVALSEGEASILSLWENCVMNTLLDLEDHNPTPQQRYCALQVFALLAVKAVRADLAAAVQTILTKYEAFVKMLVRSISVSSDLLNQHAMSAFNELCSALNEAGAPLSVRLAISEPLRKHGLDARLLQSRLIKMGVSDDADKLTKLMEVCDDLVRKEARINMILAEIQAQAILKAPDTANTESLLEVVNYLLRRACVTSKDAPQLDEEDASLAAMSAMKLVATLSHHEQLRLRKARAHADTLSSFWKESPAHTLPGASLRRAVEMIMALESDKACNFWVDIDDDVAEGRADAAKLVKKLKTAMSKAKDETHRQFLLSCQVMLDTLNVCSVLAEVCGLEELDINFAELLEEVGECAKRVISGAKAGSDDDAEEEAPVVVLTDIMMAVLAAPSNDLRRFVNTAFRLMVPSMDAAALNVICEAVGTSNLLQREDQDDEEEDGDDEDAIANEENANKGSGNSSSSDSDSESGDDEEKKEKNTQDKSKEQARASNTETPASSIPEDVQGLTMMFDAGRVVEESDDEEEDSGDENDEEAARKKAEHRAATDAALARFISEKLDAKRVLRAQRKSEKTMQKASFQMKQRILDLVEIFLQDADNASDLVVLVVLPLVAAVLQGSSNTLSEAETCGKRCLSILQLLKSRKRTFDAETASLVLVSSWFVTKALNGELKEKTKEKKDAEEEEEEEKESEGEDEEDEEAVEMPVAEALLRIFKVSMGLTRRKALNSLVHDASFSAMSFVMGTNSLSSELVPSEQVRAELRPVLSSLARSGSAKPWDKATFQEVARAQAFRWPLICELCECVRSQENPKAFGKLAGLEVVEYALKVSNMESDKAALEQYLPDILACSLATLDNLPVETRDKDVRDVMKKVGVFARKIRKALPAEAADKLIDDFETSFSAIISKDFIKPGARTLAENVLRSVSASGGETKASKKRKSPETPAKAADKEAEEDEGEEASSPSPAKKLKSAKKPKSVKKPKSAAKK